VLQTLLDDLDGIVDVLYATSNRLDDFIQQVDCEKGRGGRIRFDAGSEEHPGTPIHTYSAWDRHL